MKPKIGFKAQLTSQDILNDLNFAIENGFDCFEIGLSRKPDFRPSLKLIQQIKNNSEKNNLFLIVHTPFYLPISTAIPEISTAAIKVLKRGINLAKRVGAKIIDIHPGRVEIDPNKNFEALAKNIRKVMKMSKKYRIKISLENSLGQRVLCGKPEDLLRIVDSVKGLGITFDAGHANVMNLNPTKYFKKVKGFVINMHLHDNSGKTDEHALFGKGNINFKSLLKECKNADYCGPFILELYPHKKLLKGKEILLDLWSQI